MSQRDIKIWNKFLQKSNIIFATNYFNFIVLFSSAWASFFFFDANYILYVIGIILILFYLILYKNKNKSIITSVTIYKYSDIFIEVLKSFKITKQHISHFKNFISKTK